MNTGARGIIGFGGTDNLANPTTFGIGLGNANTVGTFLVSNLALGVNALVNIGTATWQAAGATGGTGTLTFTLSTPSNVAGTFSFTLNPIASVPIARNTASGTKVVTNGAFNIKF